MSLFVSRREKHLWFWVLAVLVAIFSTLFLGKPLAHLLRNQDVQAAFFIVGMLLVATTIVLYGLKRKPGKIEISTLLGILAVYSLLFLRLGLPERSHLIEYSVLAIFIYKALVERARQRKLFIKPPILALVISFLIGVLEESVQIVMPNRVFDPQDILFNGFAVTMAIGTTLRLNWVRNRNDRSRNQ